MSAARRLALIVGALLLFRLGSALIVSQPGYTDAYYYAGVARRLVAGFGLSADFIWNFLEAAPGGSVPVPSHRFWMPLATVLQSIGMGDPLVRSQLFGWHECDYISVTYDFANV